MSNEPNNRLSGMKQDIQNTRTGFTQSLAASRGWIDQKLQDINSQLINIKYDLTKNMEDIPNDSFLSKVKDAIIESLETRISKLENDCDKISIIEGTI